MNDERLLELRKRYLEIDAWLDRELSELERRQRVVRAEAQIQKDLTWTRMRQQDFADAAAA